MDIREQQAYTELNELWEQRILNCGADIVRFVDISGFPKEIIGRCTRAVLFGKALSRDYINTLSQGLEPKHRDAINTERKMDSLAIKIAEQLTAAGYESTAKLKTGVLPHKTVALRAGLGFIGKNNLLLTEQYGCALFLGKVLTTAPFAASSMTPPEPRCGNCRVCADVCPSGALLGKEWSLTITRDEMITRKLCSLCLKCMVFCPYTARYACCATAAENREAR